MIWTKRFLVPFLALSGVFCGDVKDFPRASQVLFNGVVWTGTTEQSVVSALAIQGERILAVGSDEIADLYRSENTEILDLAGQFIVPGFILRLEGKPPG